MQNLQNCSCKGSNTRRTDQKQYIILLDHPCSDHMIPTTGTCDYISYSFANWPPRRRLAGARPRPGRPWAHCMQTDYLHSACHYAVPVSCSCGRPVAVCLAHLLHRRSTISETLATCHHTSFVLSPGVSY